MVTTMFVIAGAVTMTTCSSVRSREPDESMQSARAITGTEWKSIGPAGIRSAAGLQQRYSGAVVDITFDDQGDVFAGTGGGLFKYPAGGNAWVSLRDNGDEPSVSAVWVQRNDPQKMVVTTGWTTPFDQPLPGGHMWSTQNGGSSWTRTERGDDSSLLEGVLFYNYVSDPVDPTKVHAASNQGYWVSFNSGASFTRIGTETGNLTSIAVNSSQTVYAFKAWGGFYKSTNGGTNWSALLPSALATCDETCNRGAANCIPDPTTMGGTTVAMSPNSTWKFYILSSTTNNAVGFWHVTNNPGTLATTWCNLTSRIPAYGDVAHMRALAVAPKASPSNPDKILVGVQDAAISFNNGDNNGVPYMSLNGSPNGVHYHADIMVARWMNSSTGYIGTHGGIYHTTDGGLNWLESRNTLPNVLGVGLDVQHVYPYRVYGIAWDIGVHWTCQGTMNNCSASSASDDWGSNETSQLYGDGNDILVDSYGTAGVFASHTPGDWHWSRYRLPNNSTTWSNIDSGLDWAVDLPPNGYFASDRIEPTPTIYTNGSRVFKATAPSYNSWTAVAGGPFTEGPVDQLNVARYLKPDSTVATVIYAPITGLNSRALRVNDGGTWFTRGSAFPAGTGTARIGVPESGQGPVYLTVTGSLDHAQKVFITDDNGVNWSAVAGLGLPDDVQPMDIAVHPLDPNTAYLGTTAGLFKTNNRGQDWITWAEYARGFAQEPSVRRVKLQQHPSGLRVVAQTIGRSNWARDADRVRRIHASKCVPIVPEGLGLNGTMKINDAGQVYNDSTSFALTLWCPLPNADNFESQALQNREIRVDGYSQGGGSVTATLCWAVKAGGSGRCGTPDPGTGGVVSLKPAMIAPLDAQDYPYIRIVLAAKSGTAANVVWGYSYRSGE